MRRELIVSLVLTLVVMLFTLVPPAAAQRTTATFAGIVVDTSGGVLPGADVALTNEDTGIVERQVTSTTGEFIFNYVPGGSYTLAISISGFKTHTVKGISLGAAQNVRRKFEMEVGAVEESLTVSGEAALINTASPEQRINLDALEVKTLPAANRNLTNLLNIGTGLTRQEGTVEGGGSGSGGAGGIRLRLNGLGGAAMSITANGTEASANAGSRQISSYNGISKIDIVSIESVGEVQITKGISPAEFGHALAGNLNVITKAGTNVFHGSLFERYEGASLVAKPFFLKNKPASKWNQGGGSLGGPLLRDRGFFFAAFEGYRLKRALELNANVPTQRFRDLLMASLPFPETKLILDRYQLPTEPVSPTALLGVFIGAGNKENNDDHVDARGDFRIKGGNLSATLAYGHPFLTQESQLPGQPRVWHSTARRVSASYAIARGRWSAETRFGTNYTPGPLSAVNRLVDPHLQAPYAQVFTVGMQRALGSATVVDAAYVGTRGYKFRMSRNYNEPDRVTGIRPNPDLLSGGYIDNSQETTYNSLQTSMRQRLRNRVQFNLNYTWSVTRANADGDNPLESVNDAGTSIQDFFDINAEWGPAIGDVTHRFIGSVIYELPEAKWSSPLARALTGGWQVAGIFSTRTGEPLIITQSSSRAGSRPDVIDLANVYNTACCDINSNNMQYLNPAAFQAVAVNSVSRQTIRAGNVGKGQFRAPGNKNLDVSLSKSFNIGGTKRFEARADILNALNWINYASVQTSISASDFGKINGTGAARVAQLQARFSF